MVLNDLVVDVCVILFLIVVVVFSSRFFGFSLLFFCVYVYCVCCVNVIDVDY